MSQQDFDFDVFSQQEYERVCREVPLTSHSGNHPSDYETLTQTERQVVRYWINHAVAHAKRINPHMTSYGLKHHFEHEGFYVTNGQFKGAMLLAGYTPDDIQALNWCFPIRQQVKSIGVHPEQYTWCSQYTLGRFDMEYARLLFKTLETQVSDEKKVNSLDRTLLDLIEQSPDLEIEQVEERTGASQNSISEAIDRLVKQGYLAGDALLGYVRTKKPVRG